MATPIDVVARTLKLLKVPHERSAAYAVVGELDLAGYLIVIALATPSCCCDQVTARLVTCPVHP